MTIPNKSGKMIGIDGRAILPGETGAVPDSCKTNDILGVLAKDPDLTIEQATDSGEPSAAAQTGQTNLVSDAEYGLSNYGTQFLSLRQTCMAPILSSALEG